MKIRLHKVDSREKQELQFKMILSQSIKYSEVLTMNQSKVLSSEARGVNIGRGVWGVTPPIIETLGFVGQKPNQILSNIGQSNSSKVAIT